MALFVNEIITGDLHILDGNRYEGCTFIDVRLQFDGRETFSWNSACTFGGSVKFQFGNPAELVAFTIGALWDDPMIGQAVQKLVLEELPQRRKPLH